MEAETKEVLRDGKDREHLNRAQGRDRENAFSKIVMLKKSIGEHLSVRRKLDEEIARTR